MKLFYSWTAFDQWFSVHGIKILLILAIAFVIQRIGRYFLSKLFQTLIKPGRGPNAKEVEKKREDTLITVFSSTMELVLWSVVVLTILPELGINIGPLLAGVGVIGLALGMGAKSLIHDYLNGLLIIIENQFCVGEIIEIAGVKGKVISLDLRKTILIGEDKEKYIIPNGKIDKVINFSID